MNDAGAAPKCHIRPVHRHSAAVPSAPSPVIAISHNGKSGLGKRAQREAQFGRRGGFERRHRDHRQRQSRGSFRAAASGMRSICSDGTRSAISATGASASASTRMMPIPRTSMSPADPRRRARRSGRRRGATARSDRRRRDARQRQSAAAPDRTCRYPSARAAAPRARRSRPRWHAAARLMPVMALPAGGSGSGRRDQALPRRAGSRPRSGRDAPRRSVSRSTARARNACRISRRAGRSV